MPEAAPETISELTVLYTADEHGWLKPRIHDGVRRGGVAQLLSMLINEEEHCGGALEGPLPNCANASTVLLSGGDNYTGPAISVMFKGESMATAFRRLGYTASAFGNHEFDFGREQFEANRQRAAFPYLSANLVRRDGQPHDIAKPYIIVPRKGAHLGIVGLSTVSTPTVAAPHRFRELEFLDPEQTLAKVIPEVWAQGVDAVVLIAHECHDVVAPLIAKHPEWKLSFVGTGHCHRTSVELIGDTPVIGPDWRFDHYARITLHIDPSMPPRERASVAGYELVELASDPRNPEPSVDPALDAKLAEWSRQVDSMLGEVIGYARDGMPRKAHGLAKWILRAWREQLGVDLAVTTEGAIRQELPRGPISLATIHSILPFDNELMIVTVTGADLHAVLDAPEVVVEGLQQNDGTWTHADGSAVDPARQYRIATTDFLYWGGDGMLFQQYDKAPQETHLGWREPVIDWTRKAGSSKKLPLEKILAR